ncbi:MAG: pirin family protein [Planctomycetota bacterium]
MRSSEDSGGAQWMKSGRGVLHTERNLLERADTMHGLQIWARLPLAEQDAEPDYRAIQASEIPSWSRGGARLRLLAGEKEGQRGPIPITMPSLMTHVSLEGAESFQLGGLDPRHEYGVYVISSSGELSLDGEAPVERGTMVRLPSGAAALEARLVEGGQTELFVLGGERAPRPLEFGGPFVLDNSLAIAEANRRFLAGEMGTLDGVPF